MVLVAVFLLAPVIGGAGDNTMRRTPIPGRPGWIEEDRPIQPHEPITEYVFETITRPRAVVDLPPWWVRLTCIGDAQSDADAATCDHNAATIEPTLRPEDRQAYEAFNQCVAANSQAGKRYSADELYTIGRGCNPS